MSTINCLKIVGNAVIYFSLDTNTIRFYSVRFNKRFTAWTINISLVL